MKISATLLGGLLTMLASSATAAPARPDTDEESNFGIDVWSEPSSLGDHDEFQSKGIHDVAFMVKSYKWWSVGNDGCVVMMCAPDGSHNNETTYRQTGTYSWRRSNHDVEPENQFSRILIGCDEDKLEC